MWSRDLLNGAVKVKTIMGITLYCCRFCGLTYRRKREADACHKSEKKKLNQSGSTDQKWRNNL